MKQITFGIIFSLIIIPTPSISSNCGSYSVPDNGFSCVIISADKTPNGDYSTLGKTSIYYTTQSEGYEKNFVLANQNIDITNLKYSTAGVLLAARSYNSSSKRYSTLTGNNLKIIADGSSAGDKSIAGLQAAFGGSVYFNNVNLEFKNANDGEINGIMAGQTYADIAKESTNDRKNYIKIQNDYKFTAIKTNLSNIKPVTGIRAIQNNDGSGFNKTGVGPTAHIVIGGDYIANITAAYGNGVYVSGRDTVTRGMPTVELLGDTKITLSGGGNALHIGKKNRSGSFDRDGWGAGQIIFGESSIVDIDQSNAKGEAIVLIYGGSILEAGKVKQFKVISQGSAIRVGNDFLTNSIQNSTDEIYVNINNADFSISDNSAAASLLKIDDNQNNVTFNFIGDETQLIATKSGALLQVGNSSNINMSISGGKVQGLTEMGTSSKINLTLNDGTVWQLAKKNNETESILSTLVLNNSTLNGFDHDNTSWGNSSFTLKGETFKSNNGVISLANGKAGDTLTIEGNYIGAEGNLLVDSEWNNPDIQKNDLLIITGTSSGITTVQANGNQIIGNVTQNDIEKNGGWSDPIIITNEDDANKRTFIGTAQTANAGEAQLIRRYNKITDKYEYTWALSTLVNPGTIGSGSSTEMKSIYSSVVSGYVNMPRSNMELGYTTLGTLHERRGENQILAWDECASCVDGTGQTWTRILNYKVKQNGKNRLGLDSKLYGFQIGHDLAVKRNDKGGHRLTGGYIAYGYSKNNFSDKYRAEHGLIVNDTHTGKGTTESVSLGLTNTYYNAEGSYLDLLGQLTYFHNKYEPRNNKNVSQNGWGTALSAEVGHPFILSEQVDKNSEWLLEPQAQLIYQYVKLKNFNDGFRSVDQGNQQGLRGRVGFRLAYNAKNDQQRTDNYYMVGNVWHDFMSPKAVKIGQDRIKESFSKTWGEIGLGVQKSMGKQSNIYADVRYMRNLGGVKRDGYRATVGFKYTW